MSDELTLYGATATISSYQFGYSDSYLIDTIVKPDQIELVYRRNSNVTLTSYPPQYPPPQIYKIIYTAVGDKLVASEPIYGRYISAKPEGYEF